MDVEEKPVELPTKRFTRNIEDFVCEHCGQDIEGKGYTNHCAFCLWSKHVDVNPGDRLEPCQGMMKPVGLESKRGQYVILHRCMKCGMLRRNKSGKEDSFSAILELSKSRKT